MRIGSVIVSLSGLLAMSTPAAPLTGETSVALYSVAASQNATVPANETGPEPSKYLVKRKLDPNEKLDFLPIHDCIVSWPCR